MLSKAWGSTLIGIHATLITIEVDAARGLPNETLVGLPDTVVKESKNRIKSAIKNTGFEYPLKNYIINLAPADTRKEGPLLDLPIAVAILQATGQLSPKEKTVYVGELSLSGDLQPIKGVLSIAELLPTLGDNITLVLPIDNYYETHFFKLKNIVPIKTLKDLIAVHQGTYIIPPIPPPPKKLSKKSINTNDFSEVNGQLSAKRALEVATSGGHNILLIGPPGSGKSMLAKRVPTILPNLTKEELIDIHKIHSLTPLFQSDQLLSNKQRPMRVPHHSISYAGMAGGGSYPKPGEISLAHHGVLFLDELPEFQRQVIEILRQPLEDGKILISRANLSVEYPSNFLLIAAMNPCPCGYHGDTQKVCQCSPLTIKKYWKKISGPILDRIDIVIEVPKLKKKDYFERKNHTNPYSSKALKNRIENARNIQIKRQEKTNAQLTPKNFETHCILNKDCQNILEKAIDTGMLTARSFHRTLKVARTLADMEGSPDIELPHITEAIQYRKVAYL